MNKTHFVLFILSICSFSLQECGKNCASCYNGECLSCFNNSKPKFGSCVKFTPSTDQENRCEVYSKNSGTSAAYCSVCKPGWIRDDNSGSCLKKWTFPSNPTLQVPGCNTYALIQGAKRCLRCSYSYPTTKGGKQLCRPFDYSYHKWCKYAFSKSCSFCVPVKKVQFQGRCIDPVNGGIGCSILAPESKIDKQICRVCDWRRGYSMVSKGIYGECKQLELIA